LQSNPNADPMLTEGSRQVLTYPYLSNSSQVAGLLLPTCGEPIFKTM